MQARIILSTQRCKRMLTISRMNFYTHTHMCTHCPVRRFAAAVPILAVLFPGDTLFIPALWHHNVQTCSLDEARAFFPGAVATGSHDGQQARLISLAPTGDSSSMRGSEAGGGGESLSAGGCEGSHSGAGNGGDGGGKNDGGGGADNGFSISVNVFWRHLDASFYPRKDVYGNKDLVQVRGRDMGVCLHQANSGQAFH
eukprot:735364-Pelagomonas_calceolata.AAC.2